MIRSSIFEVWHFINRRRKYQTIILVISMLIASIAETISIGLLAPFLAIINNTETFLEIRGIRIDSFIQKLFGHEPNIINLSMIFCGSIALSAVIRLAVLGYQANLSYSIGNDINVALFKAITNRDYEKYISENSSTSISGLTTKSSNLILYVILPIFLIINAFLYLLLISLLMIYINPSLTILSTVLIISVYFLFGAVTKKVVQISSADINREQSNVIKIATEMINSYRDVVVGRKEGYFIRLFHQSDRALKNAQSKVALIAGYPRYIIESIVIIGIVIAMMLKNETSDAINIAELGVMALAAQRILPVVQQAYLNFTYLKANINSATDIMEIILCKSNSNNSGKIEVDFNFKLGVELKNIRYQYPDGRVALDGISQHFEPKKIYGIKGETGSGKSTLIDILLGILFPTSGSLLAGGIVIDRSTARSWHQHISHVPQNIYLSDCTIYENIAFGFSKEKIDLVRVRDCARIAQISDVIEAWPLKYETIVGESGIALSGGQRQRIGIARALYERSSVLILDEATSALDEVTERMLMNAIHEELQDIMIIMVAHRISTLEKCDSVLTLANGKISEIINRKILLS